MSVDRCCRAVLSACPLKKSHRTACVLFILSSLFIELLSVCLLVLTENLIELPCVLFILSSLFIELLSVMHGFNFLGC